MVLGNRKHIWAKLKGCYLRTVQCSAYANKDLYLVPLKITPPQHILFLRCCTITNSTNST